MAVVSFSIAKCNIHFDTNLIKPLLQLLHLLLLHNQGLVIQVFNDKIVLLLIDLLDDGFYGRVALYEDACMRESTVSKPTFNYTDL